MPQEVVHDRLVRRGRADDTEESMVHRFEFYHAVTLPILDFFKSKGVPVYDINAAQTPEQVHAEIKPYLVKG